MSSRSDDILRYEPWIIEVAERTSTNVTQNILGTSTHTHTLADLLGGSADETLRHDGANWIASSALQNNDTNVLATGRLGVGRAATTALDVAGSDPTLTIYNSDAANVANVNRLSFTLESDLQERTFFRIDTTSTVITDATHHARVDFNVVDSGGFAPRLTLNGQNVGINTTAPDLLLHVEDVDAGETASLFKLTNTSTVAGSGVATEYEVGAVVTGQVDVDKAGAGTDGTMRLHTTNTSGVLVERVTINDTGVGIGRTPSTVLDVAGSDPTLTLYNSDAANVANVNKLTVSLLSDLQERAFFRIDTTSTVITDASRHARVDFNVVDAGTFASTLTLDGRKAGIATTSPSQTLDVAGDTRLRGHIYDSNNSAGTDDYVLSRDAGGIIWMSPTTLGGNLDHGDLLGRDDDDHSGYFWLAGRTIGQTANGGTEAAAFLTLESTTHGTKGSVNIAVGGGVVAVGNVATTPKILNVADDIAVFSSSQTPAIIIENEAVSDTDGSRDGDMIWRGAATTAGAHDMAKIFTEHDTAADDTKARLSIQVNDGSALATAITIKNTGFVGIGTVAPLALLHVQTSDVAQSPHAEADNLVVEESGADAGITIMTDATSEGKLVFGQLGDNLRAGIKYSHVLDLMSLFTPTGDNFVMDSSGRVGMGVLAPTQRLHVGENLRLDAHIYDSNNSAGNNDEVLSRDAGGVIWQPISSIAHMHPLTDITGGSTGQTIRHDGANWIANSFLYNNGSGIAINHTLPDLLLHVEDVDAGETASLFKLTNTSTDAGSGVATEYEVGTVVTGQVDVDKAGAGTDGTMRLHTTNTSGVLVERVTINDTGVGINTTAPEAKLHVVETSDAEPRGIVSSQHSADSRSAQYRIRKSRGTPTLPTIVETIDNLSRIISTGYDGVNYIESAMIQVTVEGTVAETRVPSRMTFHTSTDATPSVRTERIRIDSAGRVGIGTIAPQERLHISGNSVLPVIYGSTSSGGGLSLFSTTHATKGLINVGNTMYVEASTKRVGINTAAPSNQLQVHGSDPQFLMVNSDAADVTNVVRYALSMNSDAALRSYFRLDVTSTVITDLTRHTRVDFNTNDNGAFGVAMAINGNRLGIGTSSPAERLHVAANAIITGTLYGNTTSGAALTLESTSNATKGLISLGSTLHVQQSTTRVGIGTSSPAYALHVAGRGLLRSSSTGLTPGTNTDNVIIEETGDDAGIVVLTDATKAGRVTFGSSVNINDGGFRYDHALRQFIIRAKANDFWVFDQNGRLGVNNISPDEILHANGNILADGQVIAKTATDPGLRLWNPTETNGSRLVRMEFRGEKADGTLISQGKIEASHKGSGDDGLSFMRFRVADSAGATATAQFSIDGDDYLYFSVPDAAPTDGEIDNNRMVLYLDETANELKVRIRYSTGGLKTGTIALV